MIFLMLESQAESEARRPDNTGDSSAANHHRSVLWSEPAAWAIIDVLPIGVVIFDNDLKVCRANPRAGELIELTDRIDGSLAVVTKTSGGSVDWRAELKSAMANRAAKTFEELTCEAAERPRQLRITFVPLAKGKNVAPVAGGLIIEDVTETGQLKERLAEAEKIANVGKLAFKVAHEINNPLDGVLRYINLALRLIKQEKLEKPRQYLLQSRRALLRMANIVGELLSFSRGGYIPSEQVRIEQLVEDALKTMEARVAATNVEIVRDYAPGVPPVRAGALFQVFCNLIKNALDAMPDGGRLFISTRLSAGEELAISFRDTGKGLTVENTDMIFEPFFTTKEAGRGTGLGLAISKDIVEQYQGQITAENAPEGGSIFTIHLPLHQLR